MYLPLDKIVNRDTGTAQIPENVQIPERVRKPIQDITRSRNNLRSREAR